MDSSFCRRQLPGFLITALGGTLLHYVYAWGNEAPVLGVISAVNESVWEHMKLLFVPMFLFALLQASLSGEQHKNFWRAKLAGIIVGLLLIPTLFYTYTGALGTRFIWADISIFYAAAAAAYLIEWRALQHSPRSVSLEFPALLAIWLIAFAFLIFTYTPPELPLFRDPVTGVYGVR